MAPARYEPDHEPRRFPLLLLLFCALIGVVLFFAETVPAAAERTRLRKLESSRHRVLDMLRQKNRDLAQTERGLEFDPQTVLVEIDALGLMPEELLQRYPAGAGEGDSRR